MISFVGLGNPGAIYAKTKHNAGFWVIDELCKRWKVSLNPGKGNYVLGEKNDSRAILMKPLTGMNKSGKAVKELCINQGLLLSNVYVIVDDIDLPLGKLRIRPKGGNGCHRGMESIIYQNRDNNFPRIRFGIAVGSKLRPSEKYVLKDFKKSDQKLADEMIIRAADAAELIFEHGLNKAMNKYNA